MDIDRLRAENARLQARVDNQEPWLAALGRLLVQHGIVRFPDDVLAWRDECDRLQARVEEAEEDKRVAITAIMCGHEKVKALAERHREALEALSRRVHHREEHPWPFEACMRADCSDARAAIAATPELTNR